MLETAELAPNRSYAGRCSGHAVGDLFHCLSAVCRHGGGLLRTGGMVSGGRFAILICQLAELIHYLWIIFFTDRWSSFATVRLINCKTPGAFCLAVLLIIIPSKQTTNKQLSLNKTE